MGCSSLTEYYYEVIHKSGKLLLDELVDNELYSMAACDIGYLSYIRTIDFKRLIHEMDDYYE